MRVLLVEDNPSELLSISEDLRDNIPDAEIIPAGALDSAQIFINESDFDLIVCDLRIPSADGQLDADAAHGLAFIAYARKTCSGIPIFVLSAVADQVYEELALDMPHDDIFGNGNAQPVVRLNSKKNSDKCIAAVSKFADELRVLEDIHVDADVVRDLTRRERRVLRIFARRHNGVLVNATEATSGFSDLRVLKIELRTAANNISARAVAKIGPLEAVRDEHRRYETHVPQLLPPGSYAPPFNHVYAGAGKSGGLFYALAEDDRTLFELLQDDPVAAVAVVGQLRDTTRHWLDAEETQLIPIADVREHHISLDNLESAVGPLGSLGWDVFERRTVWISKTPQHGDLHPGNVIVRPDGTPILIDFGRTGYYSQVLDPITLELALLFHPAARQICGQWPTIDQASNWDNLEDFVAGCPIPEYVRHCRQWTTDLALTPREVAAVAYSVAVRQLRFKDTSPELARAIAENAIGIFED